MLSSADAAGPVRIVAVIDWHQSGWYPRDWEVLKAQWVSMTDDWTERYIPIFLDAADEGYSNAWEYTAGCMF